MYQLTIRKVSATNLGKISKNSNKKEKKNPFAVNSDSYLVFCSFVLTTPGAWTSDVDRLTNIVRAAPYYYK